jgi:hypothetical protein
VSDGSRVFYTTVDGRVGAFTCDGAALWERHLSHQGIWSPPSLLGDRVAVICNGLLQLLNGATGALVQQIAVGHCPYSAVTFAGERAFLGGGDPPYHGMLIGFDVQVDAVQPLSCSFTQQRRMIGKEDAIDLVLQVSGASASIDRIVVDFSALDGPANAVAQARDGDRFMFNVTPGPGQRWGAYALPVVIETALGRRVATALLEFDHPAPGPRRAILPGFDDIVQEEPDWSGAALMAAMRRRYGDAVEQRDMREMVDAVRERAGYLPFDTWRIVARRALSTSAKTVSEMDEFRDDAPRA